MSSAIYLIDRVASQAALQIPAQSSILAAVSGGGDSTALLFLLNGLKERLRIKRLGVLHVNHGLRGAESDGDESFVAGLAKRLDAPFYHKKLSGRSLHGSGIEAWAREERYRFFQEVREREGYTLIATGHTADDQAETVFFRLMRGTGLRGLRGVLALRDDGVVRPLLGVSGAELRLWLKEKNIPTRHDSSNDDHAFSRNRIRHDLLPAFCRRSGEPPLKLALIAERAQAFWKVFGPHVDVWVKRNVRKSAAGFSVSKNGFADRMHSSEGLRTVFEEYGIPADALHLDLVLRQTGRSCGIFLLPGGWCYYFKRDDLCFLRNPPGEAPLFRYPLAVPGRTDCPERHVAFAVTELRTIPGKVPGDNLTVLLDRSVCGDVLSYRSWNDADRFQPLGRSSSVPVREFLTKQKIGSFDRLETGVVEGNEGRIVWIPGVQIDHECRVTGASRKILKISYQSCPSII